MCNCSTNTQFIRPILISASGKSIFNYGEDKMVRVAVVGCTGKLGGMIIKDSLHKSDIEVCYAIARKGNKYVGHNMSELLGNNIDLQIIDDIELAQECDVFIDCTNADAFIENNYVKYEVMNKPLVIATTAFSEADMEKIKHLSAKVPVFITGNFSVALHDFIETLKFAAKRIRTDTDVQIIEYHHNEKKDAPSGTSLMIRDALIALNNCLEEKDIKICSVRGGNIFGEHEVIFANCNDEVITFKHSVSSRETFAMGAISVLSWIVIQPNGLYNMDNFCFVPH